MTYSDSLVFLFVEDLERASAFYRTIGLELMVDQGECHILGTGGRMMVGLCGGRTPGPEGVIVTLVSDQVEAVCARLSEAGVVFEQAPSFNARFGITHAFLRDPDGYLVEIQRFDTPSSRVRKSES